MRIRRRSFVLKAGRARKNFDLCRSQCRRRDAAAGTRHHVPQRKERALIDTVCGFDEQTEHALGEVVGAPLTGHLTIGWSGREP